MVKYSHKARELEETRSNELDVKMIELQETKEELKRAKESTTQSWLDSKPLIDELEKFQSSLASAKSKCSISNIVISELQSQLETTIMSIRSKKEEEFKVRTTINEINQSLDQTREEMEQLKLHTDEERRARSKLKQALRLRRQTLRTLQLSLRAVRLESEGLGASAAEALHYINCSEMDNTTVQLTQEEYYALTRKAKEETSLADWRVQVSMEQQLMAKESRDSTLRRLKEVHSDKKSRKRNMNDKTTRDGNGTREAEQKDSRMTMGAPVNNRETAFPKARAKLIGESSQGNTRQQLKISRSNNNKIMEKKKASIFVRIKSFLVRNITRLFG
ncbi:protein WEAK CHLOROPLAST MOVEMENT UNDER BLUE LIGHT 1-like [Cornus florida]|uniref:protein WEAK CHLOROPLAST MOVEMENT UNDER BLUE LIGHT 1-like n=1 Tax=Cornus florida TaxID=4283 RepID=UPI00289C4529|nr:protein WEAK CHLOROPLAST MOVEMENT UNDER BLUE LIGHT 1-like [Cornus florida]